MKEIEIHELVIDDPAFWGKWPWTEDKNYDELLSLKSPYELQLDEETLLRIHPHFYPIASAYIAAGVHRLPKGLQAGGIDVTCVPPDAVFEKQMEHLRKMSSVCQVVRWRHFYHCHPGVSCELKKLFKLSFFEFSDDCVGSSEIKSFPNAGNFDAGICYMYVWDGVSGEHTEDKYKSLGVDHVALAFNGYSGGTLDFCREFSLDGHERAARLRAGWVPPIWMSFIGARSCMGFREEFSSGLIKLAIKSRRRIELHGHRFPTGNLTTRDSRVEGAACCVLYKDTLFGPNYPCSGVTNSRLFDLWRIGVAQLIFDRHNELPHFGLNPEEHFIPFDGTAEGCIAAAEQAEANMPAVADMVERAYDKGVAVAEAHTTANAMRSIYKKYLDRLV
jgi:hypothetical protein